MEPVSGGFERDTAYRSSSRNSQWTTSPRRGRRLRLDGGGVVAPPVLASDLLHYLHKYCTNFVWLAPMPWH